MAVPPSRHSTNASTRRIAKRIEWTPQSAVTVDLLLPDGDSLPACWADLSVTGVMLIIPADSGIEFERGHEVELDFTIDGICMRLAGTVAWSVPDDTGKIIKAGVQFDPLGEVIGGLHPRLWEYFNRRESYRAGCEEDDSPDVFIERNGNACTGRLLDVSTSGVSVIFDETVAAGANLNRELGYDFALKTRLAPDMDEITLQARAERFDREGRYAVVAFSFPDEYEQQDRPEIEEIRGFVERREESLRDPED